jgi:pseudouridine kinase
VAHHLAQIGNPVELITHFGIDADGIWLKEVSASAGIGISHSRTTTTGTGHFGGILSPSGELYAGAADTHLEEEITVSFLSQQTDILESASLILIDCNLSIACISWLLDFCADHEVSCVIEPVSVSKASRLRDVNLEDVLLITPNEAELAAISRHVLRSDSRTRVEQLFDRGVRNVWVRRGKEGSELFSHDETVMLSAPNVKVADTTGAGDAAMAGWIHAWLQGKSIRECMLYGHALAEIILQTRGTHSDRLDVQRMEEAVQRLRVQ